MAESGNAVFRREALDRLSSPDELTEYLKVTNPSVWVVLIAVVVLLVGILAWASVGTLQTKADAKVTVNNGDATVLVDESYAMNEGMKVTIAGQEYPIESISEDEFGRTVGHADVMLADGAYDGTAVVDETRAIDFLLKSS